MCILEEKELYFDFAGYKEKLEIKTAELSNFLNMIRSASADESGGSNALHTDWKVCYLLSSFDHDVFSSPI